MATAPPPGIANEARVGASGLPLPRFASLKASRVNVRRGPGFEYPIHWVFRRAGLPVEIIDEDGLWRQIRDSEGAVGWVHVRLLSGRRTALVLPWALSATKSNAKSATKAARAKVNPVPMVAKARPGADTVALIEPGAIADILSCDGRWCEVAVARFRGWLEQRLLWGVAENERIE